MPDWSQDAQDLEQDLSGSNQQSGSNTQQSSGGDYQQEQQQQSSSSSSGGNDTKMNDVVDSAVDYEAGKEGLSSSLDPEVNNEVNKFADKEL